MEVDTTATLFNLYAWLHANRKIVIACSAAVVVIVAGVTFKIWHDNQSEADASQQLLATQSIINPTGLAGSASADTLVKIAQDYPGTIAGANAELLAAKASFVAGKYADAEQKFSKFVADHPGNELIPQANVGLAASLEAQGKISEAVAKYKQLAATYSADQNIVLPVKLTLGRLSEAQTNLDVAANYYEDLARINNPYDPWVAEAGERLRLLFAAHPELNPAAQKAAQSAQPTILTPSASEMQIAPPSATGATSPKPAETPKSSPNSPFLPMPTNLPPAAK